MSQSLLHNWECSIERICGENAEEMLDIARDIYNTGYIYGKNYMCSELEDIKAEIADEKEYAYADFEQYKIDYLGVDPEYAEDELPNDDFRYGMERALEIIDKYISGKE